MPNYDRLSAQFLDEETRHPSDNYGGGVVWGTRYYLESLLTAYEATGNPKYIQAFLDSGQSVLNLVQTIMVVDAADPGEPWPPGSGPLLSVTGWPTAVGFYGDPVPIPTPSGQVSFYAQSLDVADGLVITDQGNGTLQLAWTAGGNVLERHAVRSVADLEVLGSKLLVWGQSVGRIKPTGAGLPAPGIYVVSPEEIKMWNSEQAGGILLSFAHFLLLAKQNPGIVSEATQAEWASEIIKVATGYEDTFISDGHGGLRQHNPLWLPNVTANLDAPLDYIYSEATMR